jgi:integrase
MGFIHAVLNFSAEEGRIGANPLGKYRRPRRQLPDIEFWERNEAEDYLSFVGERYPMGSKERIRYAAPFSVLNTAVRAGELWALRPMDIKRSLSSIRLTRQLNRVSRGFAALKGKKARSVPLNSELLCELEGFLGERKHTDLIFQKHRKPIDHDAFRELFDEDVRAWGGRKINFHGLRHTAATLILLSGVDVRSLQDIMGHEDLSTTMRYVHALGDSAKRVSESFSVKPSGAKVIRLAEFG